MNTAVPNAKDVVLAGGGHSHALLLKMLGMKKLEGVRFTLVSDVELAPYSGMLPGHVAGIYSHEESHIDLRRLAEFAGARFIQAKVAGVDLKNQTLNLVGRPSIRYDILSVNTGSEPAREKISGAVQYAVPAKPVDEFLEKWNQYVELDETKRKEGVAIVGGGAGGIELALSVSARLGNDLPIKIVQRGNQILPSHNNRVRKTFEAILEEQKIEVLTNSPVVSVTETALQLESGDEVSADFIAWVTQASAPSWIAESDLAVDDKGFLLVDLTLQSKSHPNIFGAGDVATMQSDPRPKAGVYAVRMAKPLWRNIQNYLKGKKLVEFRPQKNFLSLIGTGAGEAVASRGGVAKRGKSLWKLKDRIDRKFMEKFSDLPEMSDEDEKRVAQQDQIDGLEELRKHADMRCLGCAAKVGSSILTNALTKLRENFSEAKNPKLFPENEGAEDAYVSRVPNGMSLVQTVDYMPALVSDPWLFGRITALHCLSDLFAMGAEADSILALVIVPFSSPELVEEDLFQTLSGVVYELDRLGVSLGGGHTAEGDQLALGLTCNGFASDEVILEKGGLNDGDVLILTKPIGTGTIFATDMRGEAPRGSVSSALQSMLRANAEAGQIFQKFGASGCTDVTGFGLVGHLAEMLRSSGYRATLNLDEIPVIMGATVCAQLGHLSSLQSQNAKAVSVVENPPKRGYEHEIWPLLFDPQTSGGLLAGVPKEQVEDCLKALHEAGDVSAKIVGKVEGQAENDLYVRVESSDSLKNT